jgi:hypothetical protein
MGCHHKKIFFVMAFFESWPIFFGGDFGRLYFFETLATLQVLHFGGFSRSSQAPFLSPNIFLMNI